MAEAEEAREPRSRRFSLMGGLSGRLLLLTVGFVFLAELLILGPSLADFQEGWLSDRVRAAELASLAVELAPDQTVPDVAAAQLLRGAGVVSVAVKVDGLRRSLLAGPPMPEPPRAIDLRDQGLIGWLRGPWRTLRGHDAMLRVLQAPQFREGEFVEIVVPAEPLRRALRGYLRQVLYVSLFISTLTGALVWLSLTLFLVRPMRRITESIARFRLNPDDPGARIELSGRQDEIGRAEAELSRMQADLRAALHSRARLAMLGEAVAKINHDLRNMLTSAQIASERLSGSEDPRVALALPRLERALDRAVALATGVLAYGRSTEAAPQPGQAPLAPALAAAAEDAGLSSEGVSLRSEVGDAVLRADPDQLHRILVNLLRNAREAVESVEGRDGQGWVVVRQRREEGLDVIELADNGPGVPEKARARLFQAFGSARSGGTGLGLAIARELAQAHGGDLKLLRTGPEGSTFEVRLPSG